MVLGLYFFSACFHMQQGELNSVELRDACIMNGWSILMNSCELEDKILFFSNNQKTLINNLPLASLLVTSQHIAVGLGEIKKQNKACSIEFNSGDHRKPNIQF